MKSSANLQAITHIWTEMFCYTTNVTINV